MRVIWQICRKTWFFNQPLHTSKIDWYPRISNAFMSSSMKIPKSSTLSIFSCSLECDPPANVLCQVCCFDTWMLSAWLIFLCMSYALSSFFFPVVITWHVRPSTLFPLAGGSSKTLMIVHVCPNASNLSKTLSTLNFSARARNAELSLGNRDTIKKWKDVVSSSHFYASEVFIFFLSWSFDLWLFKI